MSRLARFAAALACACLLFTPAAPAQTRRAASRPKLVVVLVVDQMRADYVDKFRQQWTRGLRRLVERGAWFRQAAYPYLNTHTCVGHATISTGTYPAAHGIVDNAWWDRETGKVVTCTEDPQAKIISYAAPVQGGESPARLMMPTFSDELRAQGGGGTRVVTFSLKARSAIMLAGHRADGVTWQDDHTGAWVTSSFYGASPFVEAYVKAHPVDADFGKTWALALPQQAYLYNESGEGKRPPEGWTTEFPHALRGLGKTVKPDAAFYRQWETSPFSDVYLGQMAQAAVDALKLGQGNGTDFLGISFSALDLAGHAYGPRSHEIQDVLVRLDQTLGALFEHLDRAVGLENYVVAFSSDHGVAPVPEQMVREGLDAGRIDRAGLAARIEKALEATLGPGKRVARVSDTDVYFAPGVSSRLAENPAARQAAREAIQSTPGLSQGIFSEQLRQGPTMGDPFLRAAALSYYPGRSGDVALITKPFWIFSYTASDGSVSIGTTHGGAYAYDQSVPVFLMGAAIKHGEYLAAASPADIAPTLAFLCGITLAHTDGRVLSEALGSAAAPRANTSTTTSHPKN